MPGVIGGSELQAARTARDDDHAAALWRYAFRLIGHASRPEDVVCETLLRGPQIAEGPSSPDCARSLGTPAYPAITPAYAAIERGDTLTALPPIAMPVDSESQKMQGNWLETKAIRQPVRAPSSSNTC